MKIDIYKSDIRNYLYLSVPANTDVTKLLPSLGPDYRMVTLQTGGVDISSGENRIALDSRKIVADIEQNGYALHEAHVTVTIGQPTMQKLYP